MTRLIETPLVLAHFSDHSCAIYRDVSNCAPCDPHQAAEFAAHFFQAQDWKAQTVTRS